VVHEPQRAARLHRHPAGRPAGIPGGLGPGVPGGALYYSAAVLLLLTHVFRDAELMAGWREPFAANPALIAFNNIRLALVGLSLGLTLAS
jgi:hypothetical protein